MTEGLCRADFCLRFSILKLISTNHCFVLGAISTESAYLLRRVCPRLVGLTSRTVKYCQKTTNPREGIETMPARTV